jgi:hypothetical protein
LHRVERETTASTARGTLPRPHPRLPNHADVDCLIADISGGGAQLVIQGAGSLPDEFVLALSRYGEARRPCEVCWRAGDRIGVRFKGYVTERERA